MAIPVLGNYDFDYDDYFGTLLFPALNAFYEKSGLDFRLSIYASENDPLEFILLRELLKARWQLLKGRQIALYGSGKNAKWLENLFHDTPGPVVELVMDDRGADAPVCWGLTPTPLDDSQIIQLPVLITSDAHYAAMHERCVTTLGSSVEFINLFKGLPLKRIASMTKLIEAPDL